MNTPQHTPIQQLKNDQSSNLSESPYRQTEFNYQAPKIDHAFIVQNYRRLRIQQRDQLASLRMPDDMKRKIFDFKEDQDLKHEKPQLVIFNHPFRGKMVLTRPQVEKELKRQRRNAQVAAEFQTKGQKVPQKFFNQMGLEQEQLELKKTKMVRQPTQPEQNYPRKPRIVSNQPGKKTAEEINKDQEKLQQNQMFFIHKQKENEETEKQRDQKMQKLIEERQGKQKKAKSSQNPSNEKMRKSHEKKLKFSDMPIIGEEPKVVRDVKYQTGKTFTSNQDLDKPFIRQETSGKKFYRPFGNQNQIRQFEKNPMRNNAQGSKEQKFGSGEGLIKKSGFGQYDSSGNENNKSLSQISAIPSNDKEDDFSDSQSLNKGLFLD